MEIERRSIGRREGENIDGWESWYYKSYTGMFWEWCDMLTIYDYDGGFTSVCKYQNLIRFYTLNILVYHISIISQKYVLKM